ncbi:MAG: glutamine synthetase type III, partial [Firmicutes bacterium]|nr:glutamine synthetase type III [Candidatus Colimorpha enterica]
PGQHELAPIFTTTNLAADSNQLTMEVLRTVARRHDFVCLLHEKPFDGVNGSGKHNNWSISTDRGTNLLEPGDTPSENAQFLIFLTSVIAAVDTYPELYRISVSGAGNDHRLGGNEAPPAIISIFLGDELTEVIDSIRNGSPLDKKEKELLRVGVHILPKFPKDSTDRNRTSPIAFTGNKFEFRTPGAPASISDINTVINTTVAEMLNKAADALENADDFETALHNYVRESIIEHGRVLFNGNGYGAEWKKEAEKRGLPNLPSTPKALRHYLDEKNVELMTRLGIFTLEEMTARREIMLENYRKIISIEALTMIDMARKEILPAISAYRRDCLVCSEPTVFEKETATKLGRYSDRAYSSLKKLERYIGEIKAITDHGEACDFCLGKIIPAMDELRASCDAAELITSKSFWPYPSYGELLLRN